MRPDLSARFVCRYSPHGSASLDTEFSVQIGEEKKWDITVGNFVLSPGGATIC